MIGSYVASIGKLWQINDNAPKSFAGNEMARKDESPLIALEQAFIAEHSPTGGLDAVRPTIIRFYLQGQSKLLTFRFLQSAGLVSCSQRTFFRWIANNMNLEAEAQAYLQDQKAADGSEALDRSSERGEAAEPPGEERLGQARATPARYDAAPAGASNPPISHAKLEASADVPAGSSAPAHSGAEASVSTTADADSMSESISHAKLGGVGMKPNDGPTDAQVRATPAETAQQENALTTVASKPNVASPRPPDQSNSTLSTTQQTSVKSTQGKAPMSDEKRRQLVEFLRQQTSDLERNDMGATADRALARLNQRDMENGGRDG
ncbi:hypothetical protein ACSFA0_24820 [Variovorax sp. LT1P1]|uniref:hypothetical protein n=1 Tax=Variovorax sp. LT1P1 TaxID=3443730 RepID=UPI003F476B44